jgi:molybdenum cofactor biosynthesis enzyme MoaA
MNKQELEKIGFYTLNDFRAAQTSLTSPLWRCELILTDRCNFTCPYCRGIEEEHQGDVSWEHASFVIKMWGANNLKNVRFSGGEPTMWHVKDKDGNKKNLIDLVALAKSVGIERIAISTNGSIKTDFYDKLIDAGVNDFSISLDSCCSETGDKMAGDKPGAWKKVVKNIEHISKKVYVTVGVVFTPENMSEFKELVEYADSLGVADIRILSSAQWNQAFYDIQFSQELLNRHPILQYRMKHFSGDRHVRGLKENHSAHNCPLMLDDMAILNGYHFPCVIYMREQGAPVGKVDFSLSPEEAIKKIRKERLDWIHSHDTHQDLICKKNCLDACVDYNNKVNALNPKAKEYSVISNKKIIPIKLVND